MWKSHYHESVLNGITYQLQKEKELKQIYNKKQLDLLEKISCKQQRNKQKISKLKRKGNQSWNTKRLDLRS